MRTYKLKFGRLIFILYILISTGCGDDDSGTFKEKDLIGSWQWNSVDFEISVAGQSLIDWYVDQGFTESNAQILEGDLEGDVLSAIINTSRVFNFKSQGSFSVTLSGSTIDGSWTLEENVLSISDGQRVDLATVLTLSSNTLIIEYEVMLNGDLNNDGTSENYLVKTTETFRKI